MTNKTAEWEKTRAKLKRKFFKWGVTNCELRIDRGCWLSNGLGFAHPDKRRFLKPAELDEVVLACNYCHDLIEKLPREVMKEIIKTAIETRISILKAKGVI